jgi:chorismate-pyruvate lyase
MGNPISHGQAPQGPAGLKPKANQDHKHLKLMVIIDREMVLHLGSPINSATMRSEEIAAVKTVFGHKIVQLARGDTSLGRTLVYSALLLTKKLEKVAFLNLLHSQPAHLGQAQGRIWLVLH